MGRGQPVATDGLECRDHAPGDHDRIPQLLLPLRGHRPGRAASGLVGPMAAMTAGGGPSPERSARTDVDVRARG